MTTVRYRVHWVSFFFPFLVLLHLPDGRDDAAGQLEDDRGGDVRHDAEGEDRRPGQAAAQGVVEPEERRRRAEFRMKSASAVTLTPGGGDVGADPVDQQREEREQELPLQLVVDGELRDRAGAVTSSSTRAAGRLDLRPRRRGDGDAPDRCSARSASPVAEELHRRVDRADEARRVQRRRADLGAGRPASGRRRFTGWARTLKGLVKPRLGSRRYIGICPPSNPGLVPPPVRALWPLCPLPDVLPRPDRDPGPPACAAAGEPRAGRRLDRVTGSFCLVRHHALLRRRHLDEVAHLVQHPADRRRVRQHDRSAGGAAAPGPEGPAHGLGMPDPGPDLLHAHPLRGRLPGITAAWYSGPCRPTTDCGPSSALLPRAGTRSGPPPRRAPAPPAGP